jgi:hypothetical protein
MKHTRNNCLSSCALLFQEQVFVVKYIIHPGAGKKLSRIQGLKNHRILDPDPQH